MRALVMLLLLANAGFFAWSHWIAPPRVTGVSAPVRAPGITLANEVGPETSSAASPGAVLEPGVSCVSVGPFLDLTEAASASTSLRGRGLMPRQRATEGLVWAGFWVKLEGIAGRDDAEQVVARLKQAGMGDAYVMPSEGRGVTVSLGLFTERQRALRRLDEVQALGYRPTVSERQRTGTVYWIDIDVRGAGQVPDPASFESESGRILRLTLTPCEAESRDSRAVPETDGGGIPG